MGPIWVLYGHAPMGLSIWAPYTNVCWVVATLPGTGHCLDSRSELCDWVGYRGMVVSVVQHYEASMSTHCDKLVFTSPGMPLDVGRSVSLNQSTKSLTWRDLGWVVTANINNFLFNDRFLLRKKKKIGHKLPPRQNPHSPNTYVTTNWTH